MNSTDNRKFFYHRLSELYRLQCIGALLGWDQQVYMPAKAAQARADQLEYMALAIHHKSTDPEFMKVVDELNEMQDTLSPEDQVNVREVKRVLDKQRKLPEDFISEVSQTEAISYSTWVEARPKDDFEAVRPYLEKLVELSKRKCDLIGYEENPYDALLDDYEPGAKTSIVKPLLLDLAEQLRVIIPPISAKYGCGPEPQGEFDTGLQHKLCSRVAESLGFSFESGRIDTTAHPFMTTLGPRDYRITTRYNEANFLPALYGIIHETGHALYELGLPDEWAGTPMGEAVSLGIHESQSRLWENLVGRSREFCVWLTGVVAEFFPGHAKSIGSDGLWGDANHVCPSLIRVDADEVTYSQHIVIRMILEERLINGDLSVRDLPEAWNQLYETYLGITPPNNRNGVMQDVHWYHGSIGYFPTYALGNLYNAMMMEKAKEDIPNLPEHIQKGEFDELLAWLRENVHRHGMRFRGPDLIQNITGKPLSADPFVAYLKAKFL